MEKIRKNRTIKSGTIVQNRFDLEGVVDDMKNGFYVADINGNISYANNSFARMLRYQTKNEILGLNMGERLYKKKEDRYEFLKQLDISGYVSGYPIEMVGKDGRPVKLSVKSSYITDENGKHVGVKGIVEELPVPDLTLIDDQLPKDFQSMIHDALTGLYNYPYFMTRLAGEIKRVEWVFRPMGLMMIDVDNFSRFNEKFGSQQGDALLKNLAGVLKATLRPGDVICRQAKDQFLVILPETKKEESLEVAKKIKDAVQEKLAQNKVTCSIGISRFICGMTAQEFFLQANLGLYMAKEAGKNEACLYG